VAGNEQRSRGRRRPTDTRWDRVAGWYDGWVGSWGSHYHRGDLRGARVAGSQSERVDPRCRSGTVSTPAVHRAHFRALQGDRRKRAPDRLSPTAAWPSRSLPRRRCRTHAGTHRDRARVVKRNRLPPEHPEHRSARAGPHVGCLGAAPYQPNRDAHDPPGLPRTEAFGLRLRPEPKARLPTPRRLPESHGRTHEVGGRRAANSLVAPATQQVRQRPRARRVCRRRDARDPGSAARCTALCRPEVLAGKLRHPTLPGPACGSGVAPRRPQCVR
jgi:hypothetical protein